MPWRPDGVSDPVVNKCFADADFLNPQLLQVSSTAPRHCF